MKNIRLKRSHYIRKWKIISIHKKKTIIKVQMIKSKKDIKKLKLLKPFIYKKEKNKQKK